MASIRFLKRFWIAVGVVGVVIVLFSGMSFTVQDPSECPETWEDDPVVVSEVFAPDGSVSGYWCIVETGVTREGDIKYLTLPIGEAQGYPAWYGFIPLVIGVAGYGAERLLGEEPSDGQADRDRQH